MSREKMGASGELFETAGARLSVAQILLRTRARFAEAQEYAREAVKIFESIGYDATEKALGGNWGYSQG
jgi:hypothetical protein